MAIGFSFNQIIIVGNVGSDPDMRFISSGTAVTEVSLATNRSFKREGDEDWSQETEWHSVTIWGSMAEKVNDTVRKGQKLMVIGRNKTEKWEDPTTGVERQKTRIVADTVIFLDGSKSEPVLNNNYDEEHDYGAWDSMNSSAPEPAPPPARNQGYGQRSGQGQSRSGQGQNQSRSNQGQSRSGQGQRNWPNKNR